jgi:transaldolase
MGLPDFARVLKAQNPDSEIWWDASPTRYADFRASALDRYPGVARYIKRLLPEQWLDTGTGITGATTNPRLVARAVLEQAALGHDWLTALNSHLPAVDQARQLHDQVVAEGARLLYPLWKASSGRHGWLSAQVDITHMHRIERTVARGRELAQLSPNVMIKVPGSLNGFEAVERLVALGCSINCTLCFTVSQFFAALAAIHRGQMRARQLNVDLSHARYVITFMIGRFGDEPLFDLHARQRGILLTDTDKRWAELALYQALQALLQRWQTSAQLLLCSLRVDRDAWGQEQSWHLERTGADATLYTLTPDIIDFLLRRQAEGRPVLPAAQRQRIPEEVMNRLLCIPYFTDAYFERGIDPAAFEHHPAFITARQYACVGHGQLQAFVGHCTTPGSSALPIATWPWRGPSTGAAL